MVILAILAKILQVHIPMSDIPLWKVVFLGALQGVTEFLPVSSSGHLVIFQQYLGLGREGSFLMAFDVTLHFGTLCALLVFFWRDLIWIFQSPDGRRLGLLLIVATIPAAVIGILFKGFFEMLFADIIPTSFFLMVTGTFLWLTRKAAAPSIDFTRLGQKQAWLIGSAQAAAILPGISRSGATIAAGLFLKLKPDAAVRFSFLMAIPAILGATVLETDKFLPLDWKILFPVGVGMLTAFGVGYLAIRWMLKIMGRRQLHHFAWYCWGFGGIVLIKEFLF